MSDDLDRQLAEAKARLQQRATAVSNTERELAALHSTAPLTVLAGRPVSRRRLLAGAAAAIAVGAGGALLLRRRDGGSEAPATSPTSPSTTPTVNGSTTVPTATIPSTTPETTPSTTTTPTTSPLEMVPLTREVGSISGMWFVDEQTVWVAVADPNGAESFLIRSVDGGATWADPGIGVPNGSRPVFHDATNGWIEPVEGGLLSTTHEGGLDSFNTPNLPAGFDPEILGFCLGMQHVIVVGSVAKPDGSIVFQPLSLPLTSDEFVALDHEFSPGAGPVADFSIASQADVIWITYNDRVLVGAARFMNGGWSEWTPPGSDLGGDVTLLHTGDSPLWALVTTGVWAGDLDHPSRQLHWSLDGGDTFTQQTLPAGLADLRIGGAIIAFGESQLLGWSQVDGGTDVLRSDDSGDSWSVVGNLPGVAVNRIDAVGSGRLAAFWSTDAGAGEAAISTDQGATWSPLTV